jgi:hypothetical protein
MSATAAPTPRIGILDGVGKSGRSTTATAAPTPRIGILDGVGKSGRSTTAVVVCCDGMVRTRSDIAMAVHVVRMVLLLTIIAI